jgi:hypothetical protein
VVQRRNGAKVTAAAEANRDLAFPIVVHATVLQGYSPHCCYCRKEFRFHPSPSVLYTMGAFALSYHWQRAEVLKTRCLDRLGFWGTIIWVSIHQPPATRNTRRRTLHTRGIWFQIYKNTAIPVSPTIMSQYENGSHPTPKRGQHWPTISTGSIEKYGS